jgi:hypothetical protein
MVRVDYISKILDISDNENNELLNLGGVNLINGNCKYIYVVIEIKYTALKICADGIHITNSNKTILYNKSQLYLYNKILSKIQNFEFPHSYIIGKSYNYKKNKITYNKTSLEMMGRVNYKTNDKFIRTRTAYAINWIRDLKKHGHEWVLLPPSRYELKPNMCNINDKWQSIKELIADQTNDITQLWMCNTENRKTAELNKVVNWRTHKNLLAKDLGITGDIRGKTLQIIINMNQTSGSDEISADTQYIHPKKIHKNILIANSTMEFYVDFETINTILLENINSDFIFMIGIGYINNNNWIFKCFIADDLTLSSEFKLISEFNKYINEINDKWNNGSKNSYTLWHWGNAEQYIYTAALNRHRITDVQNNWRDLLNIFKNNNIVSRGMLNFSLKSVVKSFNHNKFIQISYANLDIINGMDAMVMAYDEYKQLENSNYVPTNNIIKKIEKYNEIDCKSIYEILDFLRKKYKR